MPGWGQDLALGFLVGLIVGLLLYARAQRTVK